MRSAVSVRFLRQTAVAVLVLAGLAATAQAQLFPFLNNRPNQRPMFLPQERQDFFNPFGQSAPAPAPADYSRAPQPAPRKPDAPPITTKVMVLGDSMADWLAYGLEDAFVDAPDIGILRRARHFSGLARFDNRPDTAWAQAAREMIAADKPNYVVMILGINDRQALRERAPAPRRPNEPAKPPENTDTEQAPSERQTAERPAGEQPPSIVAPEPRTQPQQRAAPIPLPTFAFLEFRSDAWQAAYNKRLDETIAALKSGGVPVIWVGLPALRGTTSTAQMQYLNGLYKAAAEKANILYVDVWDGFVDERGQFSVQGPDVDGQNRRLRAPDGVHFSRFGSRKLAHFVEREIQRLMGNRAAPVALPAPEVLPAQTPAQPDGPAPRPLAGPVMPLTAPVVRSEELLGATVARPASNDPVATAVLIRGEAITPPPGRADDFTWPRPTNVNFDTAPGATPPPPAPPALAPAIAQRLPGTPGSATAQIPSQPGQPVAATPRPFDPAPRPPGALGGGGGGGLFGPGGLFGGLFR